MRRCITTRTFTIHSMGAMALLAAAGSACAQQAEPPPAPELAGVETNIEAAGPPTGEKQRGGEPVKAAIAPPEPGSAAAPATEAPAIDSSRLHLTAGVDFTNRYFFRGIVQERQGFISQPWAALNIDLAQGDGWALQGVLGTWNSFHDTATGASTSDELVSKWYESDVYGGLSLSAGKWSGKAIYAFYTSPSGAFETVQEIIFTGAYDDTEALGAWALHPSVSLAVETGSNFSDGASAKRGIYLEPSISPGFTLDDGIGGVFKGTVVSFPLTLGLSLSDYYEDGAGDDDTFGFFSVGAKAAIPLDMPSGFGAWTLNLGVQGLFLGDHTKQYNSGDDAEFIATAGVSIAF